MSVLFQIADAVEAYNRFVKQQVVRARNDPQFRDQILQRWQAARAGVGTATTPTGLKLPRDVAVDVDQDVAVIADQRTFLSLAIEEVFDVAVIQRCPLIRQ